MPTTWNRCYDFKNIFAPKKSAKKTALLTQKNFWILRTVDNVGFLEQRQFFAENWLTSPKILMTSTPGIDFMNQFRPKFTDNILPGSTICVKLLLFVPIFFFFFYGSPHRITCSERLGHIKIFSNTFFMDEIMNTSLGYHENSQNF
jgi:hypothetical protein